MENNGVLKVKEWFEQKEQEKAKRYNIWFDIAERNENGTIKVENGFVSVCGEVLEETEKARKVHIESGMVDGSDKGWTTWIPKSVMA